MPITVTRVIQEACLRYRDLTRPQALLYMQEVHDELTEVARLTGDTVDYGLVSGQSYYDLIEGIAKIWSVEMRYDDSDNYTLLNQISERELDQGLVKRGSWNTWPSNSSFGDPTKVFIDTKSAGEYRFGLAPTPNSDSLFVSAATTASPVVVTFTADHGLVDGDTLFLSGILGLSGANGTFTVTYVSDGSVSLDDSTGTGAYTSGGIGATAARPFLRLGVTLRQELGESSGVQTLPVAVLDSRVYKRGIWARHTETRYPSDFQEHQAFFEQERAKLMRRKTNLLSEVRPRTQSIMRRVNQAR